LRVGGVISGTGGCGEAEQSGEKQDGYTHHRKPPSRVWSCYAAMLYRREIGCKRCGRRAPAYLTQRGEPRSVIR
jgi:hypothetical protein